MATPAPEPELSTISVGDCHLRSATWGTGRPSVVMLHDGLGSIPQWKSVPAQVSARSGLTVLAYERAGHGQSKPIPSGPWPTDWLHREADVLGQLLRDQQIEAPVIVGHSDGGSAALLHAADPASDLSAVLALAPHSWVEQVCFDSIVAMRTHQRERITRGLARYHDEPDAVFEAWSGAWVSDEFRPWDIRPQLGAITVPTLIAQGEDDSYASDDQAHLTAAAIGPNGRSQIVPGVGHIMHLDNAEIVVQLILDFIDAPSATPRLPASHPSVSVDP